MVLSGQVWESGMTVAIPSRQPRAGNQPAFTPNLHPICESFQAAKEAKTSLLCVVDTLERARWGGQEIPLGPSPSGHQTTETMDTDPHQATRISAQGIHAERKKRQEP